MTSDDDGDTHTHEKHICVHVPCLGYHSTEPTDGEGEALVAQIMELLDLGHMYVSARKGGAGDPPSQSPEDILQVPRKLPVLCIFFVCATSTHLKCADISISSGMRVKGVAMSWAVDAFLL